MKRELLQYCLHSYIVRHTYAVYYIHTSTPRASHMPINYGGSQTQKQITACVLSTNQHFYCERIVGAHKIMITFGEGGSTCSMLWAHISERQYRQAQTAPIRHKSPRLLVGDQLETKVANQSGRCGVPSPAQAHTSLTQQFELLLISPHGGCHVGFLHSSPEFHNASSFG